MNALVGIRANSAGFLSASRVKRQQAAQQIQSNAQAAQQSTMLKTLGLNAVSNKSSTPSIADQTLGKESFLQLLVQQMQAQDPLNPTDSSQMVSQLAQFSALEQMTNLNSSFTALSGNIDQLNFISASSMVGRHVTGVDMNGAPVDGTVTNIQMNGSLVYLTVGEQIVSMAGVVSVGGSP